jgi:hypothetical protein
VAAFFGIAPCHGAPGEVHAIHAAANRVHSFDGVGQRDRHEPGIDDAVGDVGQQRRVQHVIDRGDDRDVGLYAPSPQDAGQAVRAGESGEAAANDHYRGH